MNHKMMNLCLNEKKEFIVATLGPSGTSSEAAANYLMEWIRKNISSVLNPVILHESFEAARFCLESGKADLLLVANAYHNINEFYMDTSLKLAAVFICNTPLYGLAESNKGSPRNVIVATHPAPVALVKQLLPQGMTINQILYTSSTSKAAAEAACGKVNIALTNENCASLYDLHFISKTRHIQMLWSTFVRANPST